MNDMSATIIAKSDQLNADDLITGPMTVTITKVHILGEAEQPVAVHYEGDAGKPFKPCKTMRRVMVAVWGPDANRYVGQRMTLYREPDVKFGGMAVGGIRISHMTGLDGERSLALMATKGKRSVHRVRPLVSEVDPKVARVQAGAEALLGRVRAASDAEALREITSDQATVKQRAYLAKNLPDLAQAIDLAVAEKLATFEAGEPETDDGWPGPATDAA